MALQCGVYQSRQFAPVWGGVHAFSAQAIGIQLERGYEGDGSTAGPRERRGRSAVFSRAVHRLVFVSLE